MATRGREPEADPGPPRRRRRRNSEWPGLRRRMRSALGETRARLFQLLPDERDCIRLRITLARRKSVIVFRTLKRLAVENAREVLPTMDMALDDVTAFVQWEKERCYARAHDVPYGEPEIEKRRRLERQRQELKEEEVASVTLLSALVAHALLGTFTARAPLYDKLSTQGKRRVRRWFGQPYLNALMPNENLERADTGQPRHPVLELVDTRERTWFPVLERQAPVQVQQSLLDMPEALPGVRRHPWNNEGGTLIRSRRYRLYPSRHQAYQLRCFMGTARWTYNQCVAYQRDGNSNKSLKRLTQLFVTRRHGGPVDRPEGVRDLPPWVFDTPNSIRKNTIRQFRAALKAAFTNVNRRNIRRFKMHFKGRRKNRFFTITENARSANLRDPPEGAHRAVRSRLKISRLPNIPCSALPGTPIDGAVKIVNQNGFWYVIIPTQVVREQRMSSGRCTACDPGVKSFQTTMDLQGNVTHYGRNCWDRIERLKLRQRRAQSTMARFKNDKSKHTYSQWFHYAKARRDFHCATAKIKYLIDELHYQACTRLTNTADTVLLPRFSTSQMLKKSSPRTHTFNYRLLTLRHYRFRQRLQDVCERKGATLVVCSEMYTSRTCGRCNQLHLSLGNNDVFVCPQRDCTFVAGRDENAAFNILRFVCAGSLQVFTVNGQAA